MNKTPPPLAARSPQEILGGPGNIETLRERRPSPVGRADGIKDDDMALAAFRSARCLKTQDLPTPGLPVISMKRCSSRAFSRSASAPRRGRLTPPTVVPISMSAWRDISANLARASAKF